MSLYVVKPDSLSIEHACKRSPVISLLTDCASDEEIPSSLRAACDRVEKTPFSILRDNQLPEGSDVAFLWLSGEKLLEGSPVGLHRAASTPGGRSFVPVHLTCFAEFDLIGLQPRLWKKGFQPDGTQPGLRIAATATLSPDLKGLLGESRELWARLYLGLLDEQQEPGIGLERLSQLWRDSTSIPRPYASLLMRNLIVLLIRHNQHEEAEKLLKLGMDYFPLYAELPYLAALLCASKERYSEIPGYVRQATQNPDPSYVGSGGESSYRSLWLLGWVFELAGNQEMAAMCYLAGIQARPAYPPSVYGILRQRLPYETVQRLRYQGLGALPRRESQYLEPVFEYFLLHRQIEAARYILESSRMTETTRRILQKSLDEAAAAYRPTSRALGVKPGVMLVGPFYVRSSLGRINREIANALVAENEFETVLEPQSFGEVPGVKLPHFAAVSKGLKQSIRRLDLTIRHHWPPNFDRPACGKLVLTIPWEYGSIPCRWADQINQNVDELWVPSEFCRQIFARGGVPEHMIQVIPNGIDPNVFRPDGTAWRPEGCRAFVFLFVGGAIPRKGVDVLWNAYCRTFTSADDVTLVIKDVGSATFYKNMSLLEKLSSAIHNLHSPHAVILTEELEDPKLASLYRGADVVVLPYRGEGFGMPLAEGLACGRPVIATGLGPAREFCPPEASCFISAREVENSIAKLRYGPMAGPFTWFEPDAEELSRTLRWVFEHREETSRLGMSVAEKVRTSLSWERITSMQLERIRRLVGN